MTPALKSFSPIEPVGIRMNLVLLLVNGAANAIPVGLQASKSNATKRLRKSNPPFREALEI